MGLERACNIEYEIEIEIERREPREGHKSLVTMLICAKGTHKCLYVFTLKFIGGSKIRENSGENRRKKLACYFFVLSEVKKGCLYIARMHRIALDKMSKQFFSN